MTSLKSKSKRIVSRRLPGGKTVQHRESKMKGKATCAKCGAELHGIPRNVSKSCKSEKTVNRPFGGHYCSKCMREKITEISVDE
ncbi:MAG: 50S ribosomal protein L34e [Candidatus Nanoarchaeia archaeon]|jgi:large subunit ribosomal protein L34e